jgi:hypothetical protein
VSNIKKIVSFWWSNPHYQTKISHFDARVDGKIKLSILFWWHEAEEVIEATEVVEAVEVIEATKVSHARKSLSM